MTDNGPDGRDDHATGLYVVHVRDTQNKALAGHEGGEFESPPLEHEDALALVARMLQHCPMVNGQPVQRWQRAIVGGGRSVTLRRLE